MPLVDFIDMTTLLYYINTKYYLTFGCSYKEGFLFTSKYHHRINYWKPTELTQREAGNKNVLSEKLQYH